jgi:hypothetical protein
MQVLSATGTDATRPPATPPMLEPAAERLVKLLHESLTPAQRAEICFAWDHTEPARGLLRSFIANHWQVTNPCIRSAFFSPRQQQLIHEVFRNLVSEVWYPLFMRQLAEDAKGHPWGQDQSIAIFGEPGSGPFQFLLSGRHITLRADGGSLSGYAFGGPIFYAHAAHGYWEPPHHPGNVFWPQSIMAGRLFASLDAEQQERAIVDRLPDETAIGFGGMLQGVSAASFSVAQRNQFAVLLNALCAPFRIEDRQKFARCVVRQGGVKSLHIAFARHRRMSAPEWDDWRIEGPSFVWHFRGSPHVHVWVNVAETPSLPTNAHSGTFIFPDHDPLL